MNNDNRINPRVPLNLLVKITLPEQREIQIQTENISLTGIMIIATQEEFEAILHRKTPEAIVAQPELQVSFTVPRSDAKDLQVSAQRRAIHVRRISQNKYFIGLKFLQLNQSATSAIQHHIHDNLS